MQTQLHVKLRKQAVTQLFWICLLPIAGVAINAAVPNAWCASSHKEAPLEATYAHWFNEEVPYLITSDERSLFLNLADDAQRDSFISTFWRVRNPDPSSAVNTAKEEHYERLSYANEHFGRPGQHDGWRTDRGMIYITLGAPKQRQKYPETRELKPLEIWFYENGNPAIPPHFYVMFFKQSPIEDYQIYSPYIDRPQKLVNSLNAINDDTSAIKLIQRDINDEAAHIALSLIPSEPVDLKRPTPTLESDAMLNKIRNFRNLPQNRELLGARRAAQESVSHRVLLGQDTSVLTVVATRDAASAASVHYLLSLAHPGDLILSREPGGDDSYNLALQVEVTDPAGKHIYKSVQKLADTLHPEAAGTLRSERFAVEGRIPMAPGSYKLTVQLTNLATHQVFTQSRSVLVPAFDTGLGLSQILIAALTPPTRTATPLDPFAFKGVRLAPLGAQSVAVVQGSPLRVLMQIWKPAGDPQAIHGVLDVHYLIGRFENQGRQEEDQSVDRNSFDANGNLLLGHDLPTKDLAPGVYRLVVKVSDPETKAVAYQSMNFEIDPPEQVSALWAVIAPGISHKQ